MYEIGRVKGVDSCVHAYAHLAIRMHPSLRLPVAFSPVGCS